MRNLLKQLIPTQNTIHALLVVLVWSSVHGGLNADDEVSFADDIRPIFNKHCVACHGGVKQAADVSFVYRDQVVDDWIVIPGDADGSQLIERVRSDDLHERMPPAEHGPALQEQEIELLSKWIEQGAKWEQHWAFIKPQPQPLPETLNPEWAKQSIDHFVLARLEQQNLSHAGEATPERWLRRAALDLTGLPPAAQMRASFLEQLANAENQNQQEKAYAEVVDQLLASPAFGERWASVWLDQVRYADSKGLGIDGRRNIWKFRDWVIDAINRDLPFDEFTIKQIAGDLLPEPTIEDYIATAAHRVTQSNEEGGTDDEEFRIAAVLDRVNTTWQAWQGLTFSCVQCHSHPYDPLKHAEYYKFAAFFNNTCDTDLNEDWPVVQAPLDTALYQQASELDRQIESLTQQIWRLENKPLANSANWIACQEMQAKTNNQTQVTVEAKSDHIEFHTVDTVSQNTAFTLTLPIAESTNPITAIRLTALPLNPTKAIDDSEWGFSLSHFSAALLVGDQEPVALEFAQVISDEAFPFFDPLESLNAKSARGFAAYTRIYQPRQAAFVLKTPIEVPAQATLQVVLKHQVLALGAYPLVIKRGHLAISQATAFAELAENQSLQELRDQLAEHKASRAKIKSTSVPVLRERPEHLARSTHVFVRGLFLDKADPVIADTPAAFTRLPNNNSNNRLTLARWLTSEENPLTARVAVNRIWARLFGIGLVATEEDFGSSGEPPSHPQLLDHLATRFQNEFKWSRKRLLREILLSSTYRQSSVIRPELLETDSQNRLLARGPRHRLTAEIVRDQSLEISGLLSRKQFGPPVHPPIPTGVWRPFAGGDKWNTPQVGSEDRYRRSIYTYTKRSIPFPMFATFDAPSREICTPRRLRSNTPLQALMSLNDQTMIECAAAFASRIQSSADSETEQLRNGFIMATCREPDDDEIETLSKLLQSYPDEESAAGYTAVAQVLLNLDEVLTK